MPTSALPRGKTVNVLLLDEVTFGTPVADDYLSTFIYSHTLEEKEPFESDPLLGVERNNNRDTTEPAPGLPDGAGDIVAPIDFNHIGLFLKGAMGAATVTGVADPYTHVFTSGLEVIPTRTAQIQVASNLFFQYAGVFVNKLSFDIGRAAGFDRVTAACMFKKETKLTATAGGTPDAAWALDRAAKTLPIFKMSGSQAGFVVGMKAEYDNKAKALSFVGDRYISGIDLDEEATFTGSIDVRFKDSTYYDLSVSGAAFPGEILWSKSGNRSLSLAAPAMRLERKGLPISGPGGITQTYNFRCEQTADDPMLTATLKSLVAAY
jgi:hypothetical protein